MEDIKSTLSFENAVFAQFVFYATIVILKMMIMSPLTAKNRMANKAFANKEDLQFGNKPDLKVITNDPDVERVRRCHQNDLENIIPFVFVGMFYCLANPNPFYASLHFRLFAGLRFFHMIAYLTPLPQPTRALGFLGGWLVTISMAVSVLCKASM